VLDEFAIIFHSPFWSSLRSGFGYVVDRIFPETDFIRSTINQGGERNEKIVISVVLEKGLRSLHGLLRPQLRQLCEKISQSCQGLCSPFSQSHQPLALISSANCGARLECINIIRVVAATAF
jgi:hypothetical protein